MLAHTFSDGLQIILITAAGSRDFIAHTFFRTYSNTNFLMHYLSHQRNDVMRLAN